MKQWACTQGVSRVKPAQFPSPRIKVEMPMSLWTEYLQVTGTGFHIIIMDTTEKFRLDDNAKKQRQTWLNTCS